MNAAALFKLTYGLEVLSTSWEGKNFGCIVNTAIQVTAEPNRLAVTVSKENLTHAMIERSRTFTVSVLTEQVSMGTVARFGFQSGRDKEKFDGIPFAVNSLGNPYLTGESAAMLSVRVTGSLDVGTHTIFVGDVVDGEILCEDAPITYDYYHKVKKGTAPKSAPTFRGDAESGGVSGETGYRCSVCGYVYDGDVPFEELPEDYVCPVCKQPKKVFEKIS